MGIMDKFKKITGNIIDDDRDFVDDDDDVDEEYGYDDDDDADETPAKRVEPVREMRQPTAQKTSSAVNINVFRPKTYANVAEIAKCLLNRSTVILNLEETNKEDARRIVDFLCGVVFSIDGQIEPVTDSSYVITPTSESIAYTKLDGLGESADEE